MHSYFNLAENPLFVKHVRSRLRKATILPNVVIICFFSLCIIFLDQWVANPQAGVGSHLFFWLQAMILLLMGGSQVAAAVAYTKESGILDFHRVTPVPARVQVLGFLLGAPIREWLLFACTLPFALFCAFTGPWGLVGFMKLLLVQITGALLYHSIGVVTGLAGKSARGASGRMVAIIVGLNFISYMFSGEGVQGPKLLSPIPVYVEVADLQGGPWGGGAFRAVRAKADDPPFFSVPIPLVFQTLLFQSSIFLFLMMASTRRFRSNRLPLYSKPQAMAFMATLALLTLGSVWQTSMPTLVLSTAYFLTFSAFWLTASATPALGEYMKGLQRARRLGGAVPAWSDLASNKLIVLLFAGAILASIGLAFVAAPAFPGKPVRNLDFVPWGPLVVGVFAVLSYGWAFQYFNLRYDRRAQPFFGLYLFAVWVVPIVLGSLFLASGAKQGLILMSASPFVGIATSSLIGNRGGVNMDPTVMQVISIAPPVILSFLFGALLMNEERRRLLQVKKEHEVRHADDEYEDVRAVERA